MTTTKIQILGAGCTKCRVLEDRVRSLAAAHRIDVDISKVTDLEEIMGFGVMMTPGLVVDGVLKSYGNIPRDEQLLGWLKGAAS